MATTRKRKPGRAECLLMAFNYLSSFIAGVSVSIGLLVIITIAKPISILISIPLNAAELMFCNALLAFMLCFIGSFAIVKQSKLMMHAFVALASIAFVLQFIGCFLARSGMREFNRRLPAKLHDSLIGYSSVAEHTAILDAIQTFAGCCGVDRPEDWRDLLTLRPTSVPDSCCAAQLIGQMVVANRSQRESEFVSESGCGANVLSKPMTSWPQYIYTSGCVDALKVRVSSKLDVLHATCLLLSAIQLVKIALATFVAHQMSDTVDCDSDGVQLEHG